MLSPRYRLKFSNDLKFLFATILIALVTSTEQHDTDCDENFFRCRNGRCISLSFICDGYEDCGHGDMSDEENCHLTTTPAVKPCNKDEYQCKDRLCIPSLWVCDGESDCSDGSDETHGCSEATCDGFQCHSKSCIPKEWECDGVRDCPDNSDEQFCAKKPVSTEECNIHENGFMCHDSMKCIELEEVCNSHPDCDDGSDEGGMCLNPNKTDLCSNLKCPTNQGCIILPEGPVCTEVCKKGYHFASGSCFDIDECITFGRCDQICINTNGGYNCSCIEGYRFDNDLKKCKARGSEGILFFTSNQEIRGYYLDSEIYFKVVENLPHATGVAYDGVNVYWTTVADEEETIVKAAENGENQKIIVTSGIGRPEDLAVDWVTKNVYFTDSKLKYVGVCSNDGYYCLILHEDQVEKPRAIVLHSSEGLMYWSDWGTEPAIMRSGMDGSNVIKFIKDNIHWPNGLAIDYGTNYIYWVDAKEAKIECVKLDGTDRRKVPSSAVKHPFSIDIFEDRIYWSDWDSDQIVSCNKFSGKDCHTIIKERDHKIYGIHVYHPSMIKEVINPCFDVQCSDICLIAPKNADNELEYSCACPYHKKLSRDHHTCIEDKPLQTIIVGSGQQIFKIQHKKFGGFVSDHFKLTILRKIGALAYDPNSDKIIVSDLVRRKIFSVDWKTLESEPLIEHNIGRVVGMDVDYYENNLYWIDDEKKTIEVMNLQNKHRLTLIRDLNEGLNDIALVLEHGFMFVALSTFEGAHIDRISMDGRHTSRIHVIEDKLFGPLSLSYDPKLERLFWSDQMGGEIASTGVDGIDRHIFKEGHSGPVDVAITESEVFWLGYGARKVFWSNKFDGSLTKRFLLDSLDETDNMKIIGLNKGLRKEASACNSLGNCSHVCLLSTPMGICACPDGMELGFDRKTCQKLLACKEGQYKCTTGECISKSMRCNGRPDCRLGDDEEYCSIICSTNKFACIDGSSCIEQSQKCDSKVDCNDGSDEKYCESNRNCTGNEFQCTSGECVPKVAQCDGMSDCSDGSDESSCNTFTCKTNYFRCNTGNCIPSSWECDSQIDCSDGSDEGPKCSEIEGCGEDQFTCDNGHCISHVLVCNHEDDCEDSSDEKYCYFPKTKKNYENEENKTKGLSKDCQFLCPSDLKICLPASGRCNGTSECPDGEDELRCNKCSEEEFTCSSSKRCLPMTWVCDNVSDCEDQSDEMHCLNGTLAVHDLYNLQCDGLFCKDNKKCIPLNKLCDSHMDCNDGSDEKGLCGKGCEHAACHHKCKETPMGPRCECLSGFTLEGDGRACNDINECEKLSSCSQYCHNSVGSYSCSCMDYNFQLRSDKIRCKAKGTEMKYYFATKKEIKYKSQSLQQTVVVYQSQRDMDMKGMDFDMNSDVIFWTSEISGYLYKVDIKSKNVTQITNLIRPTKVSYDWVTGNIYVLENFKIIRVCNFKAKLCSAIYTAKNGINIETIVLDPKSRIMFWSESKWLMSQTPNSTLQQASMSAENPSVVLSFDFSPVNDIVVDHFHKVVYWSNPIDNKIERCTYDGKDRTIVVRSEYPPRDLVLFEDYLYWVNDQKQSHFIRPEAEGTITKYGLYGSVYMKHESVRLLPSSSYNEIKAFQVSQSALQPEGINHCSKITCNYLCISNEREPVCFCEDGLKVKPGDICYNHTGIHFKAYETENVAESSSVLTWFFWIVGLVLASGLGYGSYYFVANYVQKNKIHPRFSVFFPVGRSETHREQGSQVHQFENPTYSEVIVV
ncbi:vitellogenin receptor isoform X1 [Halyomorpha halys]|uniref:vitellogenin receptor isoform X1 n=1 Tax=Halyomorpha halys TaxID=286706 RepID=UPI0006D50D59|nr:vitellogenin receptor [Halyomorpha halys]